MNQKQLITIAALASFAMTAQAGTEVSVGPDNVNRLFDDNNGGAGANSHYDAHFSTWDGASDRWWHTLVNTESATFTSALETELGALGAGESYQINSATLVVGSTSANSKADTYNSPTAGAYVVTTAYNPDNVTFNDSDTGTAADWTDGQFTTGASGYTSNNYSGSNLVTGVFTQTGSDGSDIFGYTTFTFDKTVVQSWLTSSQDLVFNGGGVTHWSAETVVANVNWVLDAEVIPEPGTYALMGGLLALGYVMVRRRR